MHMKKYTYIIGLFLVSTFGSCTKFVDYNPQEDYQITADNYFKTAEDYQKMAIGVYSPMQWLWAVPVIGEIASDNSVTGGENATDQVALQQIDDYQIVANNGNLTEIWKACYEGINRANYLEENKAKLDFTGKTALYGEVYFLRAYYYFELVRFFGDVPLFVDGRLTAGDAGTLSRTPKEDVYAQIELDLQNAISTLPNSQSQVGRVNKFTANALLGKVLLYQDKFTEAATAFDQVIGVYSLVSDYGSQFLSFGENGPESVFEIQYTNTSNWYDWGCPQCSEGNYGIIMNGPRGWDGPEYAQGWSFNVPVNSLYESFEEGDTRRDASILDMVAYSAATGARLPYLAYTLDRNK